MDIEASPYPYAIDLYADDHRPPGNYPPQEGLCGWMRVSRISMEFPFASYEGMLVSCVDMDGYPVSNFMKQRLLNLRRTQPRPVDHWVPQEELDEVEEGLIWDFIGTVDLANLDLLAKAEEGRERSLRRLDQRVRSMFQEAEDKRRQLARDRRAPGVSWLRRNVIGASMERLQAAVDQLAEAHARDARELRTGTDDLEEAVLEGLTAMPHVEPHCTVFWEIRSHRYVHDRWPVADHLQIERKTQRNRGELVHRLRDRVWPTHGA